MFSQALAFSVATRSFEIQLYLHELEFINTDRERNFLNLENRSFENVSFSQLGLFVNLLLYN